MIIIDPDSSVILDANKAAVSFYGYTKKELVGMKMYEINTMSEQKIKEEMKKTTQLKRNYFHFKHRLKSSEIRDVEVYSGPIEFKDKTVLCSIIHDISQQNRVLKTLEKSESTIRAMINATKSLVYLLDLKGNIIMLNNPGALLFNKSPLEMIGKNFELFFSKTEFSQLQLLFKEVMDTHEPINYQKGRDRRYFDVQLYPVFNKENMVDRICVFANDITDIKMSEKVIAAVETAGGICHEMNQPLQVILGNLELLKLNLTDDTRSLEIVDTLLKQTEKLGAITMKLTNITRYETKSYIKGTIFDIDNSSKSS